MKKKSTVTVLGIDVDYQTRCEHYNSPRDIVAIRFRCCNTYYACRECHDALADHPITLWPKEEWSAAAILCGVCRTESTIETYLASGDRCPFCNAEFNPGCKKHRHLYFEYGEDATHDRPKQAMRTKHY